MSDATTEHAGFLENYTLFLMAVASAHVSKGFHAIAAQQGLSVAEWRVLACLWDMGTATVSDLARLSLLEQSRLTHLIRRIEARGLVKRHRDAANRRSVRVALTEDGAALAGDLVQQARRHERRAVIACLGEDETQQLHGLLRKLIESPAE